MSTASTTTRSTRHDGRGFRELRRPEIQVGFHRPSEGSVLYRAGGTVVLCTASVDAKVPPFLEGKGQGWVTAEYQMHPRANPPRRESRDGRGKAPSGRTQEIQRLVGRALRAAVDLASMGERQISIDCDVLEADGGTRTASITGGFLALALALDLLKRRGDLITPVLRMPVAAISVGHVNGAHALDLVYVEDSRARVDLNVVATETHEIVEIQGTAEGHPVPRNEVDRMVDLALEGIGQLCGLQRSTLAGAGVDLDALLRRPEEVPA
ncbi:MAG: ribonuclease PH [Deltaproteobacteria bacterium]|nr:ribonuclease PH [Deltaproteobacteria bacterium]